MAADVGSADDAFSSRSSVTAALLLAALSSCGLADAAGDGDAGWQSLARGFEPAVLSAPPTTVGDFAGAPVEASACAEGRLRVRVRLGRDRWNLAADGVWVTLRPFGALADPARTSVHDGPRTLPLVRLRPHTVGRLAELDDTVPAPAVARQLLERADGPSFFVSGRWLWVVWPEQDRPPESLILEQRLELGGGDPWRVALEGLVADGLPLFPGAVERVFVDVPADGVLRFAVAGLGVTPGPRGSLRLRIALDGEELVTTEVPLHAAPRPASVDVRLPGPRAGAELAFSVEGPAAMAVLLDPVVGTAGAPRGDRRPDLVMVLADTFRADNLGAWGGDPELTPNLNRFAAGALRFRSAETPATWTLPAHAAMFSGLYPPQCAVKGNTDRLPDAAHTLAERLAASGYRTAAITEGALVSRTFGLDQGFQWFEEHKGALEETVERARWLLERDQDRPLFLFVHSYRAHAPYRVSRATCRRLGDRYELGEDVESVLPGAVKAFAGARRGEPVDAAARAVVRPYEHLYRGASADLDRGLGPLLDALTSRVDAGRAAVVFTSDHGEAFGEHGVAGHGSGVWHEQSRVPLCLRAPGVTPGDDFGPASLVDLPRTLCALAGVEPHAQWMGRDLLAGPAGPVFTFQARAVEGPDDLAVRLPDLKLIVDGARLAFAYDVGEDPLETANLAGDPEAQRSLQALQELLRTVSTPVLECVSASIDRRQAARLEALGYAGDG